MIFYQIFANFTLEGWFDDIRQKTLYMVFPNLREFLEYFYSSTKSTNIHFLRHILRKRKSIKVRLKTVILPIK